MTRLCSFSRRSEPMPFCFRNADGDEVYFIHKGRGCCRATSGHSSTGEGDYIVIPKGTNLPRSDRRRAKFHADRAVARVDPLPSGPASAHYAPVDYDVIETPEPGRYRTTDPSGELRVRRRGEYTFRVL